MHAWMQQPIAEQNVSADAKYKTLRGHDFLQRYVYISRENSHGAALLQEHLIQNQVVQALDAGGEGDAGQSRGLDIASLVHRYGRSFVHSNPDVALEYYMQVSNPSLPHPTGCSLSWQICQHLSITSRLEINARLGHVLL